MKKICTINFYNHVNLDSESGKTRFICEIEIINEITKESFWRTYFGETKKKAYAKAQAQATKYQKSFARIYG